MQNSILKFRQSFVICKLNIEKVEKRVFGMFLFCLDLGLLFSLGVYEPGVFDFGK